MSLGIWNLFCDLGQEKREGNFACLLSFTQIINFYPNIISRCQQEKNIKYIKILPKAKFTQLTTVITSDFKDFGVFIQTCIYFLNEHQQFKLFYVDGIKHRFSLFYYLNDFFVIVYLTFFVNVFT